MSELNVGDALEWLQSLGSGLADLVFTSPPYEDSRTYGIGCKLKGQAWVDWLAPIIVEAARVSRGLVIVNMSSPMRDGMHSPAVEWLVSDLTRQHGLVCGASPYAWIKNGIPGKRMIGHRRCWEPLYTFALPDRLPLKWSDLGAFSEPQKYRPRWVGARGKDGRQKRTETIEKGDALPGDVIMALVGGGHMGANSAHGNEAAMPVSLAEKFVCWYCPPGGVVLDPFCGSGTTGHAAIMHGRRFVGCDIRPDQIQLSWERLRRVTRPFPGMESGAGVPHPEPLEVI